MNHRSRYILRRATQLSPWLTLALLLGMAWELPNRNTLDEQAIQRKAVIAQALDAVPYFIDSRWVGEDSSERIPREAQELLHPNAILSRTYSCPGGPAVNLLIIHCGDARDMIGHYPPICYPSAGWVRRGAEYTDIQIPVGNMLLPAREYVFSRPRSRTGDDVIRIFNTFVLPDGHTTRDIEDIDRQSERLAVSVQGVAQIQLMTLASLSREEAIKAAGEILSGMPNLLRALHMEEKES